MDRQLYPRKEAAALLSISVDTLDALRNDGKINSCNIGTRVYITSDELTAFVQRLEAHKC